MSFDEVDMDDADEYLHLLEEADLQSIDPNLQSHFDHQHEMWKLILDGRHGLAPIDSTENVLDIATGSGIWAVDFARQYPQCNIVGSDIHNFQSLTAPNLTFIHQDDEADDWNYDHQFDYVHMRSVVNCFTDMKAVLQKAFDNMKPGGWIEIHDVLRTPEYADGSFRAPALEEWCHLYQTAASNIGRDFKKPVKYESWLKDVGFVDIEQRVVESPGNTWPSSPTSKKIGELQLQSWTNIMDGLKGGFLTAAGIANEEADELVAKAVEEMSDARCRIWWPAYIVYGRKPQDGEPI